MLAVTVVFVIMMNKLFKLSVTVVFAMFTQFAVANCDFSDFPTMPDMRMSSLLGDATYNARPIMIRSFSADSSAAELISYYKRVWRDAFSESVAGQWQQISTLEGECFFTVQYSDMDGDSTFGRLVLSNLPEGGSGMLGEGVIKSGDTTVVSDLITKDGPKSGRVTVLTSANSVSEEVSFYQTQMDAKGWRAQSKFNEAGGAVLVYRKGVDESNIIIMPAGEGTQILVNTSEIN